MFACVLYMQIFSRSGPRSSRFAQFRRVPQLSKKFHLHKDTIFSEPPFLKVLPTDEDCTMNTLNNDVFTLFWSVSVPTLMAEAKNSSEQSTLPQLLCYSQLRL
ncbi:hypothetical protein ILYODFUR_014575 [Ilyodon furcidens]|uniref:Uncharacterized protein n=1 Tax=Ilyodon furcidens TaxID=33524 RepID=A0ABV0U864_9TELE